VLAVHRKVVLNWIAEDSNFDASVVIRFNLNGTDDRGAEGVARAVKLAPL
jgi:hypothetical protein